jgi:hypothetical protein
MSTSPDTATGDRIVNLLSRWLARHVGEDALARELAAIGDEGLAADEREAVDEVVQALGDGVRGGDLEMLVRETLEFLAVGA